MDTSVVCATCHVVFAMPLSLYEQRKQDGKNFYCPNGHSLWYKDNENSRLRNDVARKQGEIMALKNSLVFWKEQAHRSGTNYTRAMNKLALLRDCTVCRSSAHVMCSTKKGKVSGRVHQPRFEAAKKSLYERKRKIRVTA